MPYYAYEAREKNGKLVKSHTFAVNKQELIKILQKEDLLILSVKESAPLEERYRRKLHKKARLRDLILFSKEMAILFENGVPIVEALDVVYKQIESSELARVAGDMKEALESGASFRDAIARHPKVFSGLWQDMIEAGELSGQLPFVMRQISIFLAARDDLQKKTVNAFLYPVLLLILAAFTIFVFIFRVVPVFDELFATFNAKLPFFTLLAVSASNAIRRYFFVFIILIAIAIAIIGRIVSTKEGRRVYENIVFRMPILGDLLMSLAIERFAATFGVLLKSGIPILRALEVSVKSTQSAIFTDKVEDAKVKIMAGLPLSEALHQTGLFPPLTVQLVLVGEKTGNFSGMMEEVSRYYSDVIDTTITRFTTLLGPIVLIFMAIIIGSLIIAMFLPIFKFATLG